MPSDSDTQCAIIVEELTKARHTRANDGWVSMPHLCNMGAGYNIHSRMDELRHKRGMDIRNKIERDECNRKRKHSFYRIHPADSATND